MNCSRKLLPAAFSCALLLLAARAAVSADATPAPPTGTATGSLTPLGNPSVTNLPDMGSGANALISRADEYQVGRMIVKNLRNEGELLEDPEVNEYIQNLGMSIGAQAQDGDTRLTYFMMRDLSVNAFAVPGGFIAVHAGLVLLTANESQLAGVLAHETGHVVQRHIARAVQAQGRQSLATMAAVLGAVLIGALGGGGDATAGIIAMAQGGAAQAQINFTRMEEYEADRLGIGYLAAAGYDPLEVGNFFEAMSRAEGLAGQNFPEMLNNHPVFSLRIAEARARASQLPHVEHTDSLSYALIRERIRVITAAADQDLRNYYAHQLQATPNASAPRLLALHYGAALAELASGSPAKAAGALRELVAQNQGVTILQSALGQAQMAAGQRDAALATFARATALFPRNVPIAVRYGEALLAAGKARQAHALLLDVFNFVAPTPEQIHLTALAASAAGDTGDAYFYMSEYHIASGDLMLASQQLELALAAPRLTSVQRKRFQARLDEIRGVLREQHRQRSA